MTPLYFARVELACHAGEEGVDNGGPDIARYHDRPFAPGKSYGHWCAAFVSWCLLQAGVLAAVQRGAKRLCRIVASLAEGGWVVKPRALRRPVQLATPAAGDVIAWHRGLASSWQGHVGLVEAYNEATDTLQTIEGNTGLFPSYVVRKRYPRGSWRARLYGVARPSGGVTSSVARGRASTTTIMGMLMLALLVGCPAPVEPPAGDAGGCIEHAFSDAINPPGALVHPAGRIVMGDAGIGVDDELVDTGETVRIELWPPVALEEYAIAARRDGADANSLAGEHEWRAEDVRGATYRGWSGGYGDRTRLVLSGIVVLELRPSDGDSMAVATLAFCRSD